MRRQKCRIWWPEQLLSCKLDSSLLLFGWFFCSHTAVDIVVATGTPLNQIKLLLPQSLQEILFYSNRKLPTLLQDCSKFSIVGFYAVEYCHESSGMVSNQNGHLDYESFNQRLQSSGVEFSTTTATNYGGLHPQKNQDLFKDVTSTKDCRRWQCSCDKLDRFLERCGRYSIKNDNWIQLCSHPRGFLKEIAQIPKLDHMHCSGDLLTTCDVHVISYKQPTYGIHHFSLSSWSSSEPVETHSKRPEWVEKLHEKQPISELETVFLALNSASAAKTFSESGLASQHSLKRLQIISILLSMTWRSIAILLASFSTIFYIILNICHGFLCYASQSLSCTMLAKVFSHTWKNLHIRSCQFLYSPIFLQGSGSRLQSSVEYAHRAALHRHSIWSAIFIDVVLGNVVGWALLLHGEAVYFWILHLVRNITNNLLRSGCVWLMGVPAGFKLNTELAAILGMVSLNAIQFWSTLWFFMSFLFRYFVQSLAISGIILGATIPLALCIDMLKLATFHLSTLHWLISLLYSQQIQALASLWRLFRGRKWNPLRQRLDSYDYTVEQHVVGSLLFTPLLLLLPTSSVFYIFFSIMKATASVISILIEITISVLHATPYAEIFLWMVRRKRFPSGIWFEIIPVQSSNMPTSKISLSSSGSQGRMTENYSDGPESVALVLHSNFATLGQVILPHYRKAFRGASLASGSAYAYGVLSGQRIPSSLGTGLPSTMPWISISFLQYWELCYDAIHAV